MNGQGRWWTIAAVAAVVVGAMPETASAYERTQTCNSFGTYSCKPDEEPKPIAWPVRCVRYRVNERGSSDFSNDDTISDDLRDLVQESFASWNTPECTDFRMVEGDLTSNKLVQYKKNADWDENMNLVVWRDDDWPYGTSMNAAFALTSVTYSSSTGRIADADIEINSDTYEFTRLKNSKAGKTDKVDLANTLTHEVGHFLGLDHTEVEDATMYRSAPSGEVKKRTLHQDDIEGLCAIYPGNDREGACQYPKDFKPPENDNGKKGNDGACCAVGSSPLPRLPVLISWCVIGLAILGRRRRR